MRKKKVQKVGASCVLRHIEEAESFVRLVANSMRSWEGGSNGDAHRKVREKQEREMEEIENVERSRDREMRTRDE